jgi:DMSO/TMAO reductase YedYZ molybdopterin-dependent catalytic subunit
VYGASRRDFIRLLGGAVGVGLTPLNFGCDAPGAIVRGSPFVPTPAEPLTPTGLFYVNCNFGLPVVPAGRQWRLRVEGLVDQPWSMSFEHLRQFEQVTREVTLECIGNRPEGALLSSAAFTGPRLRDVLREAGVSAHAHGVRALGLDGFPAHLPITVLDQDDALIALAMNGEDLDELHGSPARLLLPGRYGMFSIKWLDSLTLTRTWYTWGVGRGVANFADGQTRVRSQIAPTWDGRTVPVDEPVEITGLAVTPGRGVARVEVELDGRWQEAELTFNTLEDTRGAQLWSLWRVQWTPRAVGTHVLRVRAFDPAGVTQTEERRFPYDSSAIHSVRVVVRG